MIGSEVEFCFVVDVFVLGEDVVLVVYLVVEDWGD